MISVKVLLSTYNGETYLAQMLDSLFAQVGVNVSLLVRDDGSKDRTRAILDKYAQVHAITVLKGENIGWRDSFMTLLKAIPEDDASDYYAFADQDDIYFENKLQSATTLLADFADTPTLYHSNVIMADDAGKPLGDRYLRSFVPTVRLPQAYFDVTWLGTTMVFNRKMMALIRQHVPVKSIIHDAYVINLAQFFGKIVYDPTPHMLYRRHGGSVTGFGASDTAQKIKEPSLLDRYRRYKKTPISNPFSRRAHEILQGYNSKLSEPQRRFLVALDIYRTDLKSRLYLLLAPSVRASKLRPTLQIKYRVLTNTL
ncbi:glycosyltransferase [Lacticaseibacillus paracasei]|uniref:glycosyltransferase n=1 Tax=Lacticaseibacillus paracasei TaxID=1597 RepID=UPI0021A79A45|nr:glycosyltransferase [Lacticaseibacillus paracasei]MCT4384163.1 glycosyltransferase [Lacticaseibacillus paracasei]